MPDTSPPSDDSPSSLSPFRRNWVWFSLQAMAQVAFTIWFRARTRGMENLPKDRGGLLLMNHQSFLDPLVVGVWLKRPVSYLARDSLFRVPVIGWILRNTYVLPINRAAGGSTAMREIVKRLQAGFLVGIFPEGTRSDDEQLGEMKPGFLAIVRRAKVPVIPVGVDGTGKAYGRKMWIPRPRRVRVVIGEPLDPAEVERLSGKGHEEEMLTVVREKIDACRNAAHLWPRVPGGSD